MIDEPFEQDRRYMRLALQICRDGIAVGQSPFGACIVRDDEPLACEHNRVWRTTDPTAHAEVVAIRTACQSVGSVHLVGSTIYSTTEPCPMCFGAIHWAGISRIVYATSIADAAALGFNELEVSNEDLRRLGCTGVELVGGVLVEESRELFRQWSETSGKSY